MPRLTMLLNAGFSGPQAWLLLAIRRGHLGDIAIDLTPGTGAWNAAPGLVAGGHDLAYGDVHSLVEVAARQPEVAPIGIFAVHNASPSAIAVLAAGPIGGPADLPGRRLTGHASDVALRCFPAYAAATGIDPAGVAVAPAEGAMANLVARLRAGEADGLFGYVSTITAAIGRDAARGLRFLRYDAALPDSLGSLVMASPRLVRDEPALLDRLCAALARGVREAMAEPAAAMDAVLSFAPAADPVAERLRWETTLAVEMANPTPGLPPGAIAPGRLARSAAAFAASLGLPPPDPDRLFTSRFLGAAR
jgi:NitT/TauT family transport system substrate-binding protein